MHILSTTLSIWFWLAWAVLTAGPGLTSVLILVRCLRLLKTDKNKYAQVPVEDWLALQSLVPTLVKLKAASADGYGLVKTDEYQKAIKLAQQAYDVCVGMIPDSAISASKVGGTTMIQGADLDPADFVKK